MNPAPHGHRRLVLLIAEYAYFLSHRSALAQASVRQGFEVHVYTRVPAGEVPVTGPGLHVVHVPIRRSFRDPIADLSLILRFARDWRALRPAIVHNVSLKLCGIGSAAAWLAGVPGVVNAFTGLGYAFRSEGMFAALLRAAATPLLALAARRRGTWSIVQNPDDLEQCRRRGLIAEARCVLIEGSGVDLRRFRPAPERHGEPVVLFAARLLWDKGIGEFVEAARLLKARGTRARFVAIGDPDPENPRCVDAATLSAWRAQGVVELPGHQADPAPWLRRADVFCHPSYHEGVPKALLEAAAAGLAIVASDIPGCRVVVEQGVNGLLVAPRDAPALAAALEKLLADAARREAMGREGRRRAEQRFDVESINARILELYNRVLEAA